MATGIPFLRGERVHLRPLLPEDAAGAYPEWLNDPEVCRGNTHHRFPYDRAAAADFIAAAGRAADSLTLAIVLTTENRHVGNVALQAIHPIYRSAEFAILIGDRPAWGTGIGREAAILICDHGFAELNLHRIACGTFADNLAMQKLASALGMKEEGRRREAAYKSGRFVDVIEFGVLRSDYVLAATMIERD